LLAHVFRDISQIPFRCSFDAVENVSWRLRFLQYVLRHFQVEQLVRKSSRENRNARGVGREEKENKRVQALVLGREVFMVGIGTRVTGLL
jgi:hypothetical protein